MVGLPRLSLEESDSVLVRRFARDHDGKAFALLVGRYADMVYATCRRVVRDDAQADDAVQETFFHLVKNASRIRGSLGSWLHQVATRRAIDLIRQNAARRRREQAYVIEKDSPGENTWSEIEPAVDEALEELPETCRELLVLHFLQGRSTIQIAAAKGVSQPTISRRMSEALELLRESLRSRGILAGLVPLQTVLLHSNYVAPVALKAKLGKIALAKAAAGAASWISAESAPSMGLGGKLACAAVLIALPLGAIWLYDDYASDRSGADRSTVPVRPSLNFIAENKGTAQAGTNGAVEPPPSTTAQMGQPALTAVPAPLLRGTGQQPGISAPVSAPTPSNGAPASATLNPVPQPPAYAASGIPMARLPAQGYTLPAPGRSNPAPANPRTYPYATSFRMFPNAPTHQPSRTNFGLREVQVLGPAPALRFAPSVSPGRYPVQPLMPGGPVQARQPGQLSGF